MSRKSLRIFMCAAVAATLGMFGTAAQATFYGGDFDPPDPTGHFTGHFIVNDVNDNCLSDSEGCQIDLVSSNITGSDTFGPGWFSNGQTGIAFSANFDGGLHFLSDVIPLSISDFVPAAFSSLAQATCGSPSLMFTTTPGGGDSQGFIANLGCFDGNEFISGDTATYLATVVPEPGSLGLLVGGIGAAWLTRRRKTTA